MNNFYKYILNYYFMFNGIIFNKNSHYEISKPDKIFFSENSIISEQGLISLELDNCFYLYESKGKTLVFDINSKKRVFYGNLKLDKSLDFVLDSSSYSLHSLVKRGILRDISLFDAFENLHILDDFISSLNYLSHDSFKSHPRLNLLEFLKVSGLNAPLKYEFSRILSDKYYVLTRYGSKYLYMVHNKINSFEMRTLHKLPLK